MASTKNGSNSGCRTRPTVTCRSCIASNSAACVFGGVRLISSAKIDVGKQRPFEKAEFAAAGRAVLLDDFRAGDVGRHQVGRELHAAERQAQAAGQRADHQRFGQPRHAFQQAMAPAEERNQQLFDHLVLADDDLGKLLEDFFAGLVQLADGGRIVGGETVRAWSGSVNLVRGSER